MTKVLVVTALGLVVGCGKVQSTPDADVTPIDAMTVDADPCATATCECTAATEDTDCGAHEYCNVTPTSRVCECVAGYTSGASGCVWTGSIQDPGFASPSTWTVTNGALLNTTAVGGLDAGEVTFVPGALCALAVAKQEVEMPPFRKAEPLVLVLSYKNAYDFNSGSSVAMGVAFGAGWSPLPTHQDANFHTVRLCLPGGGYAPEATTGRGAPVTLAFGPYAQPNGCPNTSIANFAVDHASIVAASPGECGAMPGQGPNFDAEGDGGWTFTVSGGSQGGFVPGIGANGTRAARVVLSTRCSGAGMQTTINASSVANPALELFVGVGPGANASMRVGTPQSGAGFAMIPPAAGTSATLRACLPPSLRGQTLGLAFSLSGGSGLCSDVLNHQVWADNVRVVDDPACATTDNLTDPGFEQGSSPLGAFGSSGTSTAAAVIRTDAGLAHGGSRYLSIESYGRCTSSGFAMLPTVPAPVGTAGPALKFFANVGVNPDAQTSVYDGRTSQTLTEGGGYQQYTVCLNPVYVGRPQTISINHYGGSGLCDNSNYTPQKAAIDDITVTTDPACPAM